MYIHIYIQQVQHTHIYTHKHSTYICMLTHTRTHSHTHTHTHTHTRTHTNTYIETHLTDSSSRSRDQIFTIHFSPTASIPAIFHARLFELENFFDCGRLVGKNAGKETKKCTRSAGKGNISLDLKCAYAHASARTYIHTHTRSHTHTQTHARIRTHTYTHARTRTQAHRNTRTQQRKVGKEGGEGHTHTHTNTHINTHTYTHTHTFTHTYTHNKQQVGVERRRRRRCSEEV